MIFATPRKTRESHSTSRRRPSPSTAAGIFDESSAEIVDYCEISQRLFVSNAADSTVDVFDGSKAPEIPLIKKIDSLGGAPNSVAVNRGVLAVAVEHAEDKTMPGTVVFYDTLFTQELSRVEVGSLPDMLTFTPDGTKVLVANEGEPNDLNTVDPPGSVSIIDLGDGFVAGATNVSQSDVQHVEFSFLDAIPWFKPFLIGNGVRLFGKIYNDEGEVVRDTNVAEDLEPEYIAVNPAGTKAFVAMQENNTIAVIDIETASVDNLLPLGWKDHSLPGNGFDASDRDGMIDIRPRPVLGMYQPDAIAAFDSFGKTFLITANEGDSRDYDNFSEEVRVADLVLDPQAFPNAEELQASSALGRLKTTTTLGDTDGDGDHDEIYTYGARSFTIWDTEGNVVFDSGDQFEQVLSQRFPEVFNSSNDNASFDNRSDDKGPEPEAVVVGQVGDRVYAFIGLERMGGFMIYDVTYPYSPFLVDYVNDRNYDVDPEDDFPAGGHLGPEGLRFIPADKSPGGVPTLVVASEVSGTTALYEIELPVAPKFTLQIVHSSDNESFFQDPNSGEVRILGYGGRDRRSQETWSQGADEHTLSHRGRSHLAQLLLPGFGRGSGVWEARSRRYCLLQCHGSYRQRHRES